MGKRIALVLIAAAASVTLIPSPGAAAPTTATTTTYAAPFASARDWSKCDDDGGTAVCAASATPKTNGAIATAASLRPAAITATGGRAEGVGGMRFSHRLTGSYTAVVYSFYFEDVAATAQKAPAVARDIEARAFAAGFVEHTKCPTCVAQAATLVADADPLSAPPAEVAGKSVRVDVVVRNTVGKVPKGWTSVTGYMISDVGLYEGVEFFTSSAQTEMSGRLTRVQVAPVT